MEQGQTLAAPNQCTPGSMFVGSILQVQCKKKWVSLVKTWTTLEQPDCRGSRPLSILQHINICQPGWKAPGVEAELSPPKSKNPTNMKYQVEYFAAKWFEIEVIQVGAQLSGSLEKIKPRQQQIQGKNLFPSLFKNVCTCACHWLSVAPCDRQGLTLLSSNKA